MQLIDCVKNMIEILANDLTRSKEIMRDYADYVL